MKKGALIAMIRARVRRGAILSANSFKRFRAPHIVGSILSQMLRRGELQIERPSRGGPGGRRTLYRAGKDLHPENAIPPGRAKMLPPKIVHRPRNGEAQLRDWLNAEGVRLQLSAHAVYRRLHRGKYPNLKIRRANARMVFVKV